MGSDYDEKRQRQRFVGSYERRRAGRALVRRELFTVEGIAMRGAILGNHIGNSKCVTKAPIGSFFIGQASRS